ncbi:hypothetical protein GW17_00001156 [Ensete ventricosum]|nr:hypothetical protein GW17_00001156 [Ensete ventricosum]
MPSSPASRLRAAALARRSPASRRNHRSDTMVLAPYRLVHADNDQFPPSSPATEWYQPGYGNGKRKRKRKKREKKRKNLRLCSYRR